MKGAPWWSQPLSGLLVVYNPDNPAAVPSLLVRIFAFLTIMLPGFFGIREPWAPGLTWPLLAPLVNLPIIAQLCLIPFHLILLS